MFTSFLLSNTTKTVLLHTNIIKSVENTFSNKKSVHCLLTINAVKLFLLPLWIPATEDISTSTETKSEPVFGDM